MPFKEVLFPDLSSFPTILELRNDIGEKIFESISDYLVSLLPAHILFPKKQITPLLVPNCRSTDALHEDGPCAYQNPKLSQLQSCFKHETCSVFFSSQIQNDVVTNLLRFAFPIQTECVFF